MSAVVLLAALLVMCGLSCIAFVLAYPRLRAPLVVGVGLLISFTALFAWPVLSYVGGR